MFLLLYHETAAAITMTHINIYIGETFMKQTSVMDEMTITHDHHLMFVALIMLIIGTPISATTTGLIPLNARITSSLSLKDVKNIAIASIIRKGGRQLAMVATTLPLLPRNLCPVNMEMFTAKRPGAVWARVMISMKSSSFSQPFSVNSLFIAAIIGIPPPIVKAPILAKTRNIFQSETISGHKSRKNIQKKLEKIWRLRKSAYLCSPFERKRYNKFIEKIEGKYKKQVPRNTIYREALILLKGIISVRTS